MYLKMIFIHYKQIFSYNMNTSTLEVIENFQSILPTQQFVPMTFTDVELCKNIIFSFSKEDGSSRSEYMFEWNVFEHRIYRVYFDYTCKGDKPDTMVLRSKYFNCANSYMGPFDDWDWSESPRGWAYMPDSEDNSVRFYLFTDSQQQIYIFDQNNTLIEGDAFSVVRTKSYGDFFWCHSGTPGPLTSTQTSTTTEVFTKTVPNTSSQLLVNSTTKPFGTTKKPKFALWIIILIVVITLVVIIIIVVALVWYYYGGKKSSDPKHDKVAFTKVIASSANHAQGNSNQLVSASKVSIQSSMMTPSKGPEAMVHGFKAKK